MGKLEVQILRYLNKEDFRVLTAVSLRLVPKSQFVFIPHVFLVLD